MKNGQYWFKYPVFLKISKIPHAIGSKKFIKIWSELLLRVGYIKKKTINCASIFDY
jgi:hypothetical protein